MNKAMKHLIHPFVVAVVCSCSGTDTEQASPAGSASSANATMGGDLGSGSGTATNAGLGDSPPITGSTNNGGSADTPLPGAGAGTNANSGEMPSPIAGPESNADTPSPIAGPATNGGSGDTPSPIAGPGNNVGSGSSPAEGTAPDADTGGGDTQPDMGGGDMPADMGGGDMPTDMGGGEMPTDMGGGEMPTDMGGGEMPTDMGGGEMEPEPEEMGPATPEVAVFLAGDNVDTDGPLQTMVEDVGFSGGGHILVRPTNITTEPNTKHPVAIWGPGGGTPPRDYLQLLTRMASQGFVIVGIRESTGDTVLMSAAIDWLEEQDADPNSPMYERLILDRVGVFGHSMGGLSSEAAAQSDSRVTTALLDNSGSFSHDALVNVTIPVGIIYGETGQEAPNAEGDFNNPGNQGPCWLSMMAGGGHGSGPWDGASANVAWMRWHLGGENFRKDAFIGDGGAYNNNGIWRTQFKNWENWKNWNE